MRLFALLVALATMVQARAETWIPVAPEDLQMKSEPKAPKAPAIYLYRQVDRDDDQSGETIYARIKVLTEEGRKYGDIEIPFLKERESIRGVEARTIHPDGTVIEFDGTVYEKQLLKARSIKWSAKTFTLPNVEVGSIIEYRYRHALHQGYVYDSRWLLSQDLFTRHARFSLRPSRDYSLRWSWPMGLPPGTEDPKKQGNTIRLETRDVPAFVTEELMPPEEVLKFRVNFIYEEGVAERDVEKYWRRYGKLMNGRVERFIGDRRSMEQAVAAIVEPADSPETKLRKLYARTQQIRNLTFEERRSEQELDRENLGDNDDAKEVWRRGYGEAGEINWLFLALVRAAGFEAGAVLVPARDRFFFDPRVMDSRELNTNAVLVKLDGRNLYLDPAMAYNPFGLLPWTETAVKALLLDPNGGVWVATPLPDASTSRIERKVALKLNTSGTVEGRVTVTYVGLEASSRRVSQRHEDDTQHKLYLEEEIKGDVPSGIEVRLVNSPDWKSSDAPLVAEYDFKVPGWASSAGRRALVPVGLFSAGEKHVFEHASRVHPLCFNYPYRHVDEISIELPPGWKASSIPKGRSSDLKVLNYSTAVQEGAGALQLKRDLTVNLFFTGVKYYPVMRNFFQGVRAGDEDQIVIMAATPAAAGK